MTTVISDFEKRVLEIDTYFSYIENIEVKGAQLFFPNNLTHKYQIHKLELMKILKANIFLMLYNLAEASIKQSIAEIYDRISSENLKYCDVIDEVKSIWLNETQRNFTNTSTENILKIVNNIADEIIQIKFDSERIISGNIDGRKIKEFSIKYGFPSKVHFRANEGKNLHLVKIQRNNLAHGVISFAECGRNYSIGDLKTIKHEVIIYLRRILKNIELFLQNRGYAI
jgi:hypothetical protein